LRISLKINSTYLKSILTPFKNQTEHTHSYLEEFIDMSKTIFINSPNQSHRYLCKDKLLFKKIKIK